MKTSEALKQARALIDTPEKWCQGSYALNENGMSSYGDSPLACRFCSVGALQHTNPLMFDRERKYKTRPAMPVLRQFLDRAADRVSLGRFNNVVDFNDSRTHDQVMKVWDLAISLAEEEEAEQCATS